MNAEIKEVLEKLAENTADMVTETIDMIIKSGLQNEQFALDFSDKLNVQSNRL